MRTRGAPAGHRGGTAVVCGRRRNPVGEAMRAVALPTRACPFGRARIGGTVRRGPLRACRPRALGERNPTVPDGHLASDQRIADRIRTEAEAYFGPELIAGIDLRRDTGPDDEPVVFVTVVYRASSGRLDPGRTGLFGSRMWRLFDEMSESAVPVTTFMPESDFRELSAAVA